jgi:metal-responsive CopG/Arc/MetJ family transcriptional regulator
MKTIQITMDESLLLKLDAHQDTRRLGRSAVLRQAVSEYLERRRRDAIASGYRQAYADKAGLGEEFTGWEDEGRWPTE